MRNVIKNIAAQLAVMLIALVVSGCAQPYAQQADPYTQFDKKAPDAVVVLGLLSTTPMKVFGIETSGHPPITLVWSRLEPGSEAPSYKASFRVDNTNRFLGMHGGGNPGATMHVMRIPAGTYMLSGIGTHFGSYPAITYHTTELSLKEGAPFFSIKRGEVRYIGDFHVDAISRPIKIVRFTRTDQLAKAELQKSPGIHVPPFFQEPTYYPKPDSGPTPFPITSRPQK